MPSLLSPALPGIRDAAACTQMPMQSAQAGTGRLRREGEGVSDLLLGILLCIPFVAFAIWFIVDNFDFFLWVFFYAVIFFCLVAGVSLIKGAT